MHTSLASRRQLDRLELLANRRCSAGCHHHGTPAAHLYRRHDQFVDLRGDRSVLVCSAPSRRRGGRLLTDIRVLDGEKAAGTTTTTGAALKHLVLLKVDELHRVEWAWARGGRRRHNRVRVAGVGRPVR